jgi:hypothetical protein
MASVFSLLSFAAHLGAIERDLKLAGEGIIAKWFMAVRQNAMDAIGTYRYGWPELAPSTVERKGGRDEPLFDTGELRRSIGIKLYENRAVVGTNDETAEWHGMSWAYFDFGSAFGAYDIRAHSWREQLLNALMPR